MKNTKIQWADTTVNPVMGCDGCELWPSAEKARDAIVSAIGLLGQWQNPVNMETVISRVIGRRRLSEICQDQEYIAAQIAGVSGMGDNRGMRAAVIDTVRAMAKCYAGIFTAKRGASNPGFPKTFEGPQLFPGCVAKTARLDDLHAQRRSEKPWMDFLPRLIFISDMGDALSTNIQFPDLKRAIIDPVVSTAGQRHYWLWLSKRPSRMAEFATWLTENYKTEWLENLVTMTTVTSCKTLGRIDALRQVPSRFKGVSMEPVFEPVQARLEGIDWLIIGGGSDVRAEPFYAEWALGMQAQCQNAGIACFIKQLERNPHFQNKPMRLSDPHGGDWNEWPNALRWRQFPVLFCQSPAQLPIKPDRRTK